MFGFRYPLRSCRALAYWIFAAWALGTAPLAYAEIASCTSKDNRDTKTAPIRSQYYFFKDGHSVDSNACHAYVAANLIGQELGEAVSPEDIVLYGWKPPGPRSFESMLYGLPISEFMRDLSGYIEDDFARAEKNGTCRQTRVDDFALSFLRKVCSPTVARVQGGYVPCRDLLKGTCPLLSTTASNMALHEAVTNALHRLSLDLSDRGFVMSPLQALYYQAHDEGLTPQGMTELFNQICGERIPPRAFHLVVEGVRPNPFRKTLQQKSRPEILENIDRLIDQGKFIEYEHDGHAATIVGRTANCEYIIQDTIPRTQWLESAAANGPYQEWPKQVRYEGEHFQFWSREQLSSRISAIAYLSN